MTSIPIDFERIEVRHTGPSGPYGEPMTNNDIPWVVREEIGEQIICNDAEFGECHVSGQWYVWKKATFGVTTCPE
jgi:hypothetical protein